MHRAVDRPRQRPSNDQTPTDRSGRCLGEEESGRESGRLTSVSILETLIGRNYSIEESLSKSERAHGSNEPTETETLGYRTPSESHQSLIPPGIAP